MNDPASAAQQAEEPKMNEAVATEAEAKSEPVTGADPEAAAEEIMTDGTEAVEEAETKRLDSLESVMNEALAMMQKDPAEIATDEIRRLRQLFSFYHRAPQGEEAPAEPDETEKQFTAVKELELKTMLPKMEYMI